MIANLELKTPHLLHVLPTFVPAGLEMRTVHLIAGFGTEFRHSILSMDGRLDAADRLPPGAPVTLLPSPPKAGSLVTAGRLRDLLRREQPDLVLTYNWAGFDMLLAARTLGFRRVVHHEDGFNADEASGLKRRRNLARQAVLPGAYRLIVPSERLRRIAQELWGMPAERIELIPNGVRVEEYPLADGNAELRRELGIPEAAPVVGALGHLRAVKCFDRLLEACAALDPALGVHLVVVGEGEERAALEERASRPDLAGRVHLVGYRSEPSRFLRAFDLYALTSDSEQMPLSLLEAMATGLPVVSTDVGDVRSMLPEEQAPWLVPLAGEETAGALASRFAALLAAPDARARLGRANRRQAEERFAFARTLAAYREVYHCALCLGSVPVLPEPSDALC